MENINKTKWSIDQTHSEITFKAKHLMITNVKGVFHEFNAAVFTEGDQYVTSDIEFSLNTASVDTGVADRDAHLRSADFFDVENFKELSFTGRSVNYNGDGDSYQLSGDLSIKGITKPVTLEVEFNGIMKDPWGNEKAGYSLQGRINRKEWGLNWNAALEAGGVLVSEEVKIACEIQLIKQK
jgi:polyisoprenoid-binding protein YceI